MMSWNTEEPTIEERINAEKKSGGYAQGASLLLIFCELLKG